MSAAQILNGATEIVDAFVDGRRRGHDGIVAECLESVDAQPMTPSLFPNWCDCRKQRLYDQTHRH